MAAEAMHRLLQRQIRNALPADLAARPELAALLAEISSTYEEFQVNLAFTEHTLEVVSEELTEANGRLREENENRLAGLDRHHRQTLELQQGMILCAERREAGYVHTLCSGRLAFRLGWAAESVVGKRPEDFLPPALAERFCAAYAAAWEGGESSLEFSSADAAISCLASLSPRLERGSVREVILSAVDITELKRAQAEAQKLALVAARTDNAVIITDAGGRIEWTNDGFTRITGYTLGEVRGRKPGEFLQGPDTDPATVLLMRERLARGEGFRTEILNYGKGGRKYWLAIEVQPIRDEAGRLTHFMAIESDVSARRQSDESLRVQFRLSQALAGSLSLRDAPASILSALCHALGWRIALLWTPTRDRTALVCTEHWPARECPAPELVGYCRSLRLSRDEALPGRAWATAAIGWCEDLAQMEDCRCADHALREGLHGAVAVPIRAGGDVLGIVELFSGRHEAADEGRLLTFSALGAQIGQFYERKLAEEALRQRGEELLRANDELARASNHKNAFLASMSHELRTPLNSILGLTETLVERLHGPLTDKQARYLNLVLESGRHLLSLINDILDLAKIESGRETLERVVFPLAAVCREAVQIVSPMARRRNQRLDCELPGGEILFQGDPRRIKQVLVNLLGNAVKFTPETGGLGLRMRLTGDEVRLEVWDRGIGIAPADLPRLFTPFQQLDTRLSREYPGTGLGLSLVKQLATLHDGRVEVESRPGEGSTFTVVLPAARLVAPSPAATATVAETSAPAAPPPVEARAAPLILIADDTPINVMAIREYLEMKGYRVALAVDGNQAVAQTLTLRPDLILMDIQMPNLDGLDATRAIRAFEDRRLAATPIIAVTALAMERDREIGFAAGVDDYVAKPYSLRELHERIGALLVKKRAERVRPESNLPRWSR